MITVPQQMRNAGVDEMAYRKIAQQCYARMMMARGQLNEFSQKFMLDNGAEVTCTYCFGKQDIQVKIPPNANTSQKIVSVVTLHGFFTHTRNGTPRGFQFPGHDAMRTPATGIAHTGKGYQIGFKTITDLGDDTGPSSGMAYPVSSGQTTIINFQYSNGKWIAKAPQTLLFGNVDWKGPQKTHPKDRKILTYNGNPSRYWPVGQFIEIPGLSKVDHFVDGLTNSYEYMTVFGDKVYEGGKVQATMPWLYHPLNTIQGGWEANHQNAHVLGAAYRASDGRLLCIVKTCYNSYPRLKAAAGQEGFLVSAWHTHKNGVVYKDWLDDKAGAERQMATTPGLTLVEVPDPGRGYFVELIMRKSGNIPGGWTRLLRIPTPTWCDVNWFFSEDGTKACSVMFGELHTITIDGDTATHTTTSVGGFKNTISFSSELEQESNPGEPDPALAGGIFSNIYRVGVDVGDWINKDEVTQKYTSIKSGKVTIAADYKGNELVKMEASISGNESYDYFRRFGRQWGKIATMPYIADRWAPDKRIPGIGILSFDAGTRVVCVQIANACKPVVSVAGKPVVFDGSSNMACVTIDCVTTDTLTITASITDSVTGLSGTDTREFENARSPGYWVTDAVNVCGTVSLSSWCSGFFPITQGGTRYLVQTCMVGPYLGEPDCYSVEPCHIAGSGYPQNLGQFSFDGRYGWWCGLIMYIAEVQHWECT